MIKQTELKIKPADIDNDTFIKKATAQKLGLAVEKIKEIRIVRRSIDARKKQAFFLLRIEVAIGEFFLSEPILLDSFQEVDENKRAIIIGAGPAGYFAAMELIEAGIKPILFDRGKDVQQRRRSLRDIQQFGKVDPHSNYCFGEGGAGTYSDGKLYTRSHKRGNIYKSLKLFVEHGANSNILVDAHPHIGSNKLPKIIANIRQTILHYGGEIHFDSFVTDLIIHKGEMKGIQLENGETHFASAVILATGHSARDIYYLLNKKGIHLEAKPFALGLRIEHQQSLIDNIQYNQSPREQNLPAASYRLVCQIGGKGVFSFCMCPGGLVVPAATAPGEIVVNGMSLSKRDSPFANSGIVVAVEPKELEAFRSHGVFAGLEFQKSVEQKMFASGDGSQQAPAQSMTDFVNGIISKKLSTSSYIPGLHSAPLHELLPSTISKPIREGLQQFGKSLKGYYTAYANVIGTESRTSSPIRIPRNKETLMHEGVKGLFPCGEGAGYAGGIISATVDGQNVAKAVKLFLED